MHAGDGLSIGVADAGTEHASAKLKAELDRACKVPVYGVNFDFDKASLRPDAESALRDILALLGDFKDLKLELGGHTDSSGNRDGNLKLSEARGGDGEGLAGAEGNGRGAPVDARLCRHPADRPQRHR